MSQSYVRRHPDRSQAGGFEVVVAAPRVVIVRGDLDAMTAPMLADVLLPLAGQGGGVVVDLSDVTFLDASGLRVFCAAVEALDGRGQIMACNAPPRIQRVFELAQLARLLEVQALRVGVPVDSTA